MEGELHSKTKGRYGRGIVGQCMVVNMSSDTCRLFSYETYKSLARPAPVYDQSGSIVKLVDLAMCTGLSCNG